MNFAIPRPEYSLGSEVWNADAGELIEGERKQ